MVLTCDGCGDSFNGRIKLFGDTDLGRTWHSVHYKTGKISSKFNAARIFSRDKVYCSSKCRESDMQLDVIHAG
jgi:hypothetical protein